MLRARHLTAPQSTRKSSKKYPSVLQDLVLANDVPGLVVGWFILYFSIFYTYLFFMSIDD